MDRRRSMFLEHLEEAHEESSRAESEVGQEQTDLDKEMTNPRNAAYSRNLKAARSESWPWVKDVASDTTCNDRPKYTPEAYIAILQTASQRGFSAPPRHEIEKYQKKALPPIPSTPDSTGQGVPSTATLPQKPTVRVDSHQGSVGLGQTCGLNRRSELVTAELVRQSTNFVTAEGTPAWLERVQKRAENNQKTRQLLQKRE